MTIEGAATETLELVASGFAFAEGPRWHDGAVYLSDIHDDAVKRVTTAGDVSVVVGLPSSPISLGFTPAGVMLVSALTAATIWRIGSAGEIDDFYDLSPLSSHNFGDLVVSEDGRIYVANQGFDYTQGIPASVSSPVFLIDTNGDVRQVANGISYANGLAITGDGARLVVAESFAHRLLVFDIAADGSLSNRRVMIQFEDGAHPDGICCDAEGAVWSANAGAHEVVRCAPDGSITHRISTGDGLAIGCILGGDDGHDLYVTTATTADRDSARESRASGLWHARADVGAGGRP